MTAYSGYYCTLITQSIFQHYCMLIQRPSLVTFQCLEKKNPQQYCQTPWGVVNEKYHDVNRRKIEIHEDKSSFANCRIVLTRNIIMNGVEVFHH